MSFFDRIVSSKKAPVEATPPVSEKANAPLSKEDELKKQQEVFKKQQKEFGGESKFGMSEFMSSEEVQQAAQENRVQSDQARGEYVRSKVAAEELARTLAEQRNSLSTTSVEDLKETLTNLKNQKESIGDQNILAVDMPRQKEELEKISAEINKVQEAIKTIEETETLTKDIEKAESIADLIEALSKLPRIIKEDGTSYPTADQIMYLQKFERGEQVEMLTTKERKDAIIFITRACGLKDKVRAIADKNKLLAVRQSMVA